MSPFTGKNWVNEADHAGPPASPPGTPLSAVGMEDAETRITDYVDLKTVISVKEPPYNAVGDGATDDTAAIQDAIDDATASSLRLFFPAGTYKITSVLTIGATSGWILEGESRNSTTISQFTNNTPIFTMPWEGMAHWRIADLNLNWNTQQTTAHTNSIVFRFTGGAATGAGNFGFIIERVRLVQGYKGIAQTGLSGAESAPQWGCVLRDWYCQDMCGEIVHLDPYNGGAPAIRISDFYVKADQLTNHAVLKLSNAAQLTIENVEINDATTVDNEMFFNGCRNVVMKNCRTERGTVGAGLGYDGLVRFDNTIGSIVDGFEMLYKTINNTGVAAALFKVNHGDLTIRGIVEAFTTFTAGSFSLVWVNQTDMTTNDWIRLGSYRKGEASVNVVYSDGGAANTFRETTPLIRKTHVADPAGGGTQDAEARTAINSILITLEDFGFHASS